jgi:chemotaxis methyl-accepting protein methylase
MEISDELLCVFTASLEEARDSLVVEVPEQEVSIGDVQRDGTYRVALLSTATAAKEDRDRIGASERSGPPVEPGDRRTVDIEEQLSFLSNYKAYVDVDAENRTFRMRPEVRRTVTFAKHDLINDEAKSGFDLVVCRNLFIYIDNEYKEPVLSTIAESMRPGGYLVIGKAETLPKESSREFEVFDSRKRIYERL